MRSRGGDTRPPWLANLRGRRVRVGKTCPPRRSQGRRAVAVVVSVTNAEGVFLPSLGRRPGSSDETGTPSPAAALTTTPDAPGGEAEPQTGKGRLRRMATSAYPQEAPAASAAPSHLRTRRSRRMSHRSRVVSRCNTPPLRRRGTAAGRRSRSHGRPGPSRHIPRTRCCAPADPGDLPAPHRRAPAYS